VAVRPSPQKNRHIEDLSDLRTVNCIKFDLEQGLNVPQKTRQNSRRGCSLGIRWGGLREKLSRSWRGRAGADRQRQPSAAVRLRATPPWRGIPPRRSSNRWNRPLENEEAELYIIPARSGCFDDIRDLAAVCSQALCTQQA
jgi:hypothetical protein